MGLSAKTGNGHTFIPGGFSVIILVTEDAVKSMTVRAEGLAADSS